MNFKIIKDLRYGVVGINLPKNQKVNRIENLRYMLNIMLAIRFRLNPRPNLHEGGLVGSNVHLLNKTEYTLGLSSDLSFGLRPNNDEKIILQWYAELLTIIFETGHPGCIKPNDWLNHTREVTIGEILSILRAACIFSNWVDDSQKDSFDKIEFYNSKFIPGLYGYMPDIYHCNGFVPKYERDMEIKIPANVLFN